MMDLELWTKPVPRVNSLCGVRFGASCAGGGLELTPMLACNMAYRFVGAGIE